MFLRAMLVTRVLRTSNIILSNISLYHRCFSTSFTFFSFRLTCLTSFTCLRTLPVYHAVNRYRSSAMNGVSTEDAVEIYRQLSKHPSVRSGRISMEETPGHLQVYSEWSQRDLERSENTQFARGHIIQLDVVVPTPPQQVSDQLWNKDSPSGRFRAVVRTVRDKKKGEDKQWIEIWTDQFKYRSVDVEAADRHGKIYDNDGVFGCLEWNSAETHLLYVAEQKLPKTKSYFDSKPDTGVEGLSGQSAVRGDEYVYQENWGEQLSEKKRPVLCVLDIDSGMISLLENLPSTVSPGLAVWCPDDLGVVCVGYLNEPYRLGIIYCTMRPSTLYHIDLKSFKCTTIGSTSGSAVQYPNFSPDKTKLIYLEHAAGGAHKQCFRLMMCDWSTKGVVTVVEQVRTSTEEASFPGLFVDHLAEKCWSDDNKRVIITTQWRSRAELVVVDVETGAVTRLTSDPEVGSWSVLDVTKDVILAACSSPSKPQYLVIGKLPAEGSEAAIKWLKLDPEPQSQIQLSWKIVPVSVPEQRVNQKFPLVNYEYILLEPTAEAYKQAVPPLIVSVHGGPHSAFTAGFELYFSGLCLCGYAVLMVNYRGSSGFGQDSIESLLGHIGRQDVEDIQSVVHELTDSGTFDRNRVVVIGGSHGGFLTGHLIGQFPDFYRAAICRNPVINVASMVGVTDIPDWTYVESGLPFDEKSVLSAHGFEEMLKRSPIFHVDSIKTPLMIMLGGKDMRVPPYQGLELMKALKARGGEVRTLWYPECAHPLSETKSEADAFVNIIKWFYDHLKREI